MGNFPETVIIKKLCDSEQSEINPFLISQSGAFRGLRSSKSHSQVYALSALSMSKFTSTWVRWKKKITNK